MSLHRIFPEGEVRPTQRVKKKTRLPEKWLLYSDTYVDQMGGRVCMSYLKCTSERKMCSTHLTI